MHKSGNMVSCTLGRVSPLFICQGGHFALSQGRLGIESLSQDVFIFPKIPPSSWECYCRRFLPPCPHMLSISSPRLYIGNKDQIIIQASLHPSVLGRRLSQSQYLFPSRFTIPFQQGSFILGPSPRVRPLALPCKSPSAKIYQQLFSRVVCSFWQAGLPSTIYKFPVPQSTPSRTPHRARFS